MIPEMYRSEISFPPFLVVKRERLPKKVARAAVIDLLEKLGYKPPRDDWYKFLVKYKYGNKDKVEKFEDLVERMREQGVVHPLQTVVDTQDEFFNGISGISTPTKGMNLNVTQAGFSKTLEAPCTFLPAEVSLTNDILYYREEACKHTAATGQPGYNFDITSRHFRAYLSACITLVEAFINRHIQIAKFRGFTSPEFTKLQTEFNVEEKIDLWLRVFSGKDKSTVKKSGLPWQHFKELKEERNKFTHANELYTGVAIKEIGENLNKVRAGVGGLLKLFRDLQGKPSLSFIDNLRHAPEVKFRYVHQMQDGTFMIERNQ